MLNFPPAVDYSCADRGTIYPSPAVMLIGTYLKQNGYEVHLIDGAYHEDYLDRLRTILAKHGDEILYVGMSVMVTEGLVVSKVKLSVAAEDSLPALSMDFALTE